MFGILLLVNLAQAVPVSYDITINGILNETLFTKTVNEVKECDTTCVIDLPTFDVPENFNFTNYTLANPSESINFIQFESSADFFSNSAQDKVVVAIVDLKEELKISRLITRDLNSGQNNVVLQLDNVGGKDLKDVSIQISGDGVKTVGKSSVNIPTGQSDFATATVQVTNYGEIDIIIKAYSGEQLLGQTIETITVPLLLENTETKEDAAVYVDGEYAKAGIDQLWKKLDEYENEYYLKKTQEYELPDMEGDINEVKDQIGELELNSNKLTKEVFDKDVNLLTRNLEDIKTQINFAQPKKFADKLKENLILIATGLGVVVSSLTALGLAKSHIRKGESNKVTLKKK